MVPSHISAIDVLSATVMRDQHRTLQRAMPAVLSHSTEAYSHLPSITVLEVCGVKDAGIIGSIQLICFPGLGSLLC